MNTEPRATPSGLPRIHFRVGQPLRFRRSMRGRLALHVGILAALAGLTAGCSGGKPADALEKDLIHEVVRGDLVDEIVESGKITPWYEVQIKSKVSGEVSAVFVHEGESVKKGQPLMELDDVDTRRSVSLAEIDLRDAQLRQRNTEIELERNQAAFEARGISRYELDRAAQAVELARVTTDRARVNLEKTRDQLRYCKIASPMDGTVTVRNIEPGEVVTAGITATVGGESLLTIAQVDKMLLELSMNQVDIARVQVGQKATVVLDAYRDRPIEGAVSTIAAAAHTDTTRGIDVFDVEVTIDPATAGVTIKPGMTAEVRVHVGVYEQVVKVPAETVFEEDGKYYLYVVESDPKTDGKKKKEKIEVQVGHRGAREIEIARGVEPGQKIYTRVDKDMQVKM